MSSGYVILAKVETKEGPLLVREFWGPRHSFDGNLVIEVKHGEASITITPEELEDMLEQVRRTRCEIEVALR